MSAADGAITFPHAPDMVAAQQAGLCAIAALDALLRQTDDAFAGVVACAIAPIKSATAIDFPQAPANRSHQHHYVAFETFEN